MAPYTLTTTSLLSISSLLLLLASTASALPSLSSRASDPNCFPPPNSTSTSLSWTSCPADLQAPSTLQCANFSVPIDWSNPSGVSFNLGLVKLPASSASSRIGSLFLNFGGPGVPTSAVISRLSAAIPFVPQIANLSATFDLIGLDPRGIGLSNQVQCDASIYLENMSYFPKNQSQYDALVDWSKRLGQSCRDKTGPVLEHIDTVSVAKDLEAVRVALNEPLNYLGLSYGTYLGAQYAELFPDNIRTMALDGILQHSQSEAANLIIESSSYELVLKKFFTWAAADNSSALRGQDVARLWTTLLTTASTTPIPAPGCDGTTCRTSVSAEDIVFNAQAFLEFAINAPYLTTSWAQFSQALLDASKGNATALSTTYSDVIAAETAVSCLDWTHNASTTYFGVRNQEAMMSGYAPLTYGASQSWLSQHLCLGWPVPVQNAPRKLNVQTSTTILMTQSTADPATGMPWSQGMLEEIENNRYVLREGVGHTSWLLFGDTSTLIGQYLISGVPPAAGTVTTS